MGQGQVGVADGLGALRRSRLAARVFVVGVALSLGIWGVVAYRFSGELGRVEERAERVARRYAEAQEALSTLRLTAFQAEQARDPSLVLTSALRQYTPIWDSPAERAILARLRHEIEAARPVSLVAVSNELQSLNRAMFLAQEAELRLMSRRSENRLHRGLNAALLLSLVLCVVAAAYAARLEDRLDRQRAAELRYTSDLQRLSARVVAVQEDERRAIARDLHDEVGQALAAIKVELGASIGAGSDARVTEAVQRARTIADDAVRSVRDLSHLLHPPLLEELGLVPALERHVREFGRRHGIAADIRIEGWSGRLRGEMEQAIYRIVQEALSNVAKHARAQSCQVVLARRADAVVLTVTDDGVGFPRSADGRAVPAGDGLGLVGIRERAGCFSGTVDVANGVEGGGVVSVVLPIGEEVEHERGTGAARG